MANTTYSTGTISLTNGSAVVTGTGTGWQTALIVGGVIYPEAAGNPLPFDQGGVTSNTSITAKTKWAGATGTYAYAIARQDDVNQVMRNAQTLTEVIEEIRNGTIFKYDLSGSLADRNMYGAQPKGFAYLVTEGSSADLYVKVSSALNDWAGPFSYGAGPVGPPPDLGIGNVTTRPAGQPATASVSGSGGSYALNLGIPQGVQGDQGPLGPVGPVGDTGPRGITWRGQWVSGDIYSANDVVTDDDSEGDAATWIALTENSGLRPRDNPSEWQFFPASVPASLSDGLWGETPTDTANDGVWGA